jgi:hypothetical protein
MMSLNSGARTVQTASKKHWLRAVAITAAIFATWFALGILTFDDDTTIDAVLSHTSY